MEIILIILVSILMLLFITFFILFLLKKNNVKIEGIDKNDIELLKKEIELKNEKILSEQKSIINQTEKDLTNLINAVYSESNKNLNNVDNKVRDFILNQTNDTRKKLEDSKKDLETWLTKLNDHTLPISQVKDKVDRLDNLLSQNNKAGRAGEYLLERILSNIVGNSKSDNIIYKKQYTLQKKSSENKNLIVDLFIEGSSQNFVNIPVDAKFPFNAYEKLTSTKINSNEYKVANSQFILDCKKRITETAKYVSDEDKTVYAIMFIPSESIFYYLTDNHDLIDFAFKNKVIIAGPSTLMAIINSVDRYMSLFDSISSYDKKIDILDKAIKYIDNYDEVISNTFSLIEKLYEEYKKINTKETSLRKIYNKLLKENNIEVE
ncbi:DNA recombination protein RmuC [Spiroplasma litorale]|uniref:DNA recombination protein RmuC n=1 Tax=Spiroplasma litorale TaxID=216942 RepID=A0A0K1W2L5_9MOLU|nr:DNA recombination protein RmuC [Spiroplasma litorale]AKX34322.1 DNA recombination protein RmuC [Spiroplasma litorale]